MSKIIDGIAGDLRSLLASCRTKAENMDKKKLFLMSLPYIFTGYFCDKAACLWRVSPGQDISAKTMKFVGGLSNLFLSPWPSLHPKDLLAGVGCGIALYLIIYCKKKNAKKFRNGTEYGSAR